MVEWLTTDLMAGFVLEQSTANSKVVVTVEIYKSFIVVVQNLSTDQTRYYQSRLPEYNNIVLQDGEGYSPDCGVQCSPLGTFDNET